MFRLQSQIFRELFSGLYKGNQGQSLIYRGHAELYYLET